MTLSIQVRGWGNSTAPSKKPRCPPCSVSAKITFSFFSGRWKWTNQSQNCKNSNTENSIYCRRWDESLMTTRVILYQGNSQQYWALSHTIKHSGFHLWLPVTLTLSNKKVSIHRQCWPEFVIVCLMTRYLLYTSMFKQVEISRVTCIYVGLCSNYGCFWHMRS